MTLTKRHVTAPIATELQLAAESETIQTSNLAS
jgi:hypothetical protein